MIRHATPDDLDPIIAMVHELAAFQGHPEGVVLERETFRRQMFDERAAAALMVEDEVGGEPIGLAVYCFNFSTWAGRRGLYLEDLYVRPAARGRGVGLALLAELARIALSRDCGHIEWSVLDNNESAIGFYKSIGAKAMNDWTLNRLSGEALHRLAKRV